MYKLFKGGQDRDGHFKGIVNPLGYDANGNINARNLASVGGVFNRIIALTYTMY